MSTLYIFMALVNLTLPFLMIKTRASKIGNIPIDDSQWQINDRILEAIRTKFLATKQETIVELLGKKSLLDVIAKNNSENGFCFVTEKAYYFVGNVYQKGVGAIYHKTNMQHRIVANELKGVKIKRIFLFRTLVFFLLSVALVALDALIEYYYFYIIMDSSGLEQVFAAIFIITHVLCGILIFVNLGFMIFKRRTILSFEFTSEQFYFPIGILGKQEIKDFYQAVSKVQELANQQFQNTPVNLNQGSAAVVSTGNKVEQLKELSALLAQEAITAEEFASLKAEIVSEKAAKMFCPQCGAKISQDAKFCGKCEHKM